MRKQKLKIFQNEINRNKMKLKVKIKSTTVDPNSARSFRAENLRKESVEDANRIRRRFDPARSLRAENLREKDLKTESRSLRAENLRKQ